MESNGKEIRLNGKDIIQKKTLIMGDVNTGKTVLAAKLLRDLILVAKPEEITVIDFAPEKLGQIGGKIKDYTEMDKVSYFSPKTVYAPRVMGKSAIEIMKLAKLNMENMTPYLDCFLKNSSKILLLNDVTLYLHCGKLTKILECMQLSETVLVTAYYGSKLADDKKTGINKREKQAIDSLLNHTDLIIDLNQNLIKTKDGSFLGS